MRMPTKTAGKILVAGGVLLGCFWFARSAPPSGLGVQAGRLGPCPDSPNCVGSQDADVAHAIAPLPFTGSIVEARARLKRVVATLPRTRLVTDEAGYLHYESRSAVFRFVDDLEFVFDEKAQLIHVRSAARTGYSDLGVNRRRVETIRAGFAANP